jgi:hypothetical protein
LQSLMIGLFRLGSEEKERSTNQNLFWKNFSPISETQIIKLSEVGELEGPKILVQVQPLC